MAILLAQRDLGDCFAFYGFVCYDGLSGIRQKAFVDIWADIPCPCWHYWIRFFRRYTYQGRRLVKSLVGPQWEILSDSSIVVGNCFWKCFWKWTRSWKSRNRSHCPFRFHFFDDSRGIWVIGIIGFVPPACFIYSSTVSRLA